MATTWPITTEDLEIYIGPMLDATRSGDAVDAAVAYVEDRRSDIAEAFIGGVAPADVRLGAVILASLYYNQRTSPTGYGAFGDSAVDVSGSPQYPRALALIGWRRPVTA